MKLKLLIAAAAAAVTISAAGLSAFAAQDTGAFADGTAYLNLNKIDWTDFQAEYNNAEIIGNGTYTVSMTASEAVDLGQFNALEIINGEEDFGSEYTVTIDSVRINGKEKRSAESYTCSADGDAVTTRVNIYNEWNDPDGAENSAGVPDCRSADGDIASKSARIISADDLVGIKSLEVTFTVSGIKESNSDLAESAVNTAEQETEAPEETAAESGEAPSEEAPPAENETKVPATGNVPAAVMVFAMAVSGVTAAVSGKRK